MKKKNSSKNVFLTVLLVVVVLLFALYMLVYKKYTDEKNVLTAQNATLQQEINSISMHYAKKDVYIADTEALRVSLRELADEYAVEEREENIVMLAVDMQEVSDIEYNEINIAEQEILYTIPAEEVQAAGVETLQETVEFVERKTTYNGEFDYSDLKTCIEQIYNYPGKVAIHNVSITKNEQVTDDEIVTSLTGNIDVSFYSMPGNGLEYVAPEMPDYTAGTTNPFKLVIESEEIPEE